MTKLCERIFTWSASRLVGASGEPVAALAIGQDITERRQVEEELKLRSTLLDSATDSVFVYDFDGTVIYANDIAYESRGYTKERFLSMTIENLVAPEDRQNVAGRLERIRSGGLTRFETVHLRRDRTEIPVEINAMALDYHGRKLGVSIARDISERRQVEVEREKAKEFSDGLNELNTIINSTFEFNEIMRLGLPRATDIMRRDAAAITLRSGDRWTIKYVHGLPEENIGTEIPKESDRCIGLAGEQGRGSCLFGRLARKNG